MILIIKNGDFAYRVFAARSLTVMRWIIELSLHGQKIMVALLFAV